MKEIPLRIHKCSNNNNPPTSAVTLVDDDDFEWLSSKTWYMTERGYVAYNIGPPNRETILMHRLILNAPENMLVDHKDTNRLNNQRYNIHITTERHNNLNHASTTNKSGFMGVEKRVRKTYTSWAVSHRMTDGSRVREYYSCMYTAAYAYNKHISKELGDLGFRNDLSECGFTTEELEQKLITDRLIKMGPRSKG